MPARVRQRRGTPEGLGSSAGECRREAQARQSFLLGGVHAASLIDQQHRYPVDNAVDASKARVVEDLDAAIDPVQQRPLVLRTGEDVEEFLSESHTPMLWAAHSKECATRIVPNQYR